MPDYTDIKEYAYRLGCTICLEFSPSWLEPSEFVRSLCQADECHNYGKNYMCPPYIGTLEDIRQRLKRYNRAYLLQYTKPVDVRNDIPSLIKTKDDFHRIILELESFILKQGAEEAWGLIGGNCGLCQPCRAVTGEPCAHPDRARPSLESLAINVQDLLAHFGITLEFKPDEITWTGCVLYISVSDKHPSVL